MSLTVRPSVILRCKSTSFLQLYQLDQVQLVYQVAVCGLPPPSPPSHPRKREISQKLFDKTFFIFTTISKNLLHSSGIMDTKRIPFLKPRLFDGFLWKGSNLFPKLFFLSTPHATVTHNNLFICSY